MILALAAACGLHGLALVSIDVSAGGVASGSGGAASISIAAAAPGLRAVVEAWETPPEAADALQSVTAPETETFSKPPGGWDEVPVPDSPPNSLKVAELFAAPATAPASAMLRNAPHVETSSKLVSGATDVALQRNNIAEPIADLPDTRPAPMASPAPLDRAVAVTERPPARPEKTGDDEAIARRVATGTGGGVTRGQSHNVAAAVAMSPNAAKVAQAAWAAAIQKRIARHQSFPKRARGTGRVRLTMIIRSDGRMTEVRISKSSGDAAFDRAAVAAAKKAAPFPAAPSALREPWYRVGQWVNFGR